MIKDFVNDLMDKKDHAPSVELPGNYLSKIRTRALANQLEVEFSHLFDKNSLIKLIEEQDYKLDKALETLISDYICSNPKVMALYKSLDRVRARVERWIWNEYLNYGQFKKVSAFFSRKFDWRPGDYGDDGSCFWGTKSGAKDMLLEKQGFAIKFHSYFGRIGRCWGVFVDLGGIEEPSLIIFNGYASVGDIGNSLYFFADVLARTLGYKNYYKIHLHNNNGAGNNILHINRNEGVVLTQKELSDDSVKYNFKWKEIRNINCSWCRKPFREENVLQVEDRWACPDCFTKYAFPCFSCGNIYNNGNKQVYQQDKDSPQEFYCFGCFGLNFAICCHDSKIYRKSDMVIIDYGEFCYKNNLDKIKTLQCKNCKTVNHKRRSWCHNCGILLKEEFVKETIRSKKMSENRYESYDTPSKVYYNKWGKIAELFVEEEEKE